MSPFDPKSPTTLDLQSKQFLFSRLLTALLKKAWELGFEVKMGYALRSQREQDALVASGASKTRRSNHLRSLAVDLLLFRERDPGEWEYMTRSEEYRDLGEYWETLHPLCRWGGRFSDGGHFSIEDQGVK